MVLLDITKKGKAVEDDFDNKVDAKINTKTDINTSNKNKSIQTQTSANSVNEHFYFTKDLSSSTMGFILAISLLVIIIITLMRKNSKLEEKVGELSTKIEITNNSIKHLGKQVENLEDLIKQYMINKDKGRG